VKNIYESAYDLLEEGVLRNLIIYGPISTFRIWLEKYFAGDEIIDKFTKLNKTFSLIFIELDKLDVRFTKKYINKIEYDNLLNDAIFNCIYNHEYDNKYKRSDPGKCVVEYFLNINTNILIQIFYETILLLINNDIQVGTIRNIDDLKNLQIPDSHKLSNLLFLINSYVDTLIEFLASKKFNKHLTMSTIKKAIIDSTYRIEKISELNVKLLKQANINRPDINKSTSFVV